MVHFSSRELPSIRQNDGLHGERPQDYKQWHAGEQPMTAFHRPYEPEGVVYRLKQGSFMSDDYNTIERTSGKLTNVGKNLSIAANLELRLREAYGSWQQERGTQLPHKEFMDFIGKRGHDKHYEVTHVYAGNLGSALAAVLPYHGRKFMMGINSSIDQSVVGEIAPGVAKKVFLDYLLLHETAHLAQNLNQSEYRLEREVESSIVSYASHVLRQLSTAKNIGDRERADLMRYWSQIKAIAEDRLHHVKRNYKGTHARSKNADAKAKKASKKQEKARGKVLKTQNRAPARRRAAA